LADLPKKLASILGLSAFLSDTYTFDHFFYPADSKRVIFQNPVNKGVRGFIRSIVAWPQTRISWTCGTIMRHDQKMIGKLQKKYISRRIM
jgi:hypothetical protein